MAKYLNKQATSKKAPQSQPIPGREMEMTKNNAGGFAFKADSFTRMERFLILGSEGGTFYVGERDLTKENVDNLRVCIANDGQRAIQMIVDISVEGRAPKNDPAVYALALAASYGGDEKVRAMALDALPRVCRIGTHLFQFCEFINSMRGWGPALRKAVAAWYLEKPVDKLAYQLVKYQQRDGWSHRDVLRLAHPRADLKLEHSAVLRWVVKGTLPENQPDKLIAAFEKAKTEDEKGVISLIRSNGLTREMIPTEHQTSPKVWEALLERMPMTAMIRTLGRMSASGLLAPLSDASKLVVERLEDRDALRSQRVHPIALFSALRTYGQGHGVKGKLTWTVVPQVMDALDAAFYEAFSFVEPTGKNFYLGIDVSGSMTGGQVVGIPNLTPNQGAAAMAMLIARTEPNHFIGGFATKFVDLGISKSMRLDQAARKAQRDFGGTDCSVAIRHALDKKVPVDAFVVITDGETWAGDTHASQAIQTYRQKMGRDAKLIVMNMVANRTRLTDVKDLGSLDVVGFDASVPTVINGFLGAHQTVGDLEEA
jgi:60 kDa SS-A/Ro ribonucleoprotein